MTKKIRYNLYPRYLINENCEYYRKLSLKGLHLVKRGRFFSEFESGAGEDYVYYMEYLARPVSLSDKRDPDVKRYDARLEELEDAGYELVCSSRGVYGVSVFRTEHIDLIDFLDEDERAAAEEEKEEEVPILTEEEMLQEALQEQDEMLTLLDGPPPLPQEEMALDAETGEVMAVDPQDRPKETVFIHPPKTTFRTALRDSFGLFLGFLLWMAAVTLIDWLWLGRNNFFERYISWVFLLELVELVVTAYFLVKFVMVLTVLACRYKRASGKFKIARVPQILLRSASCLMVAALSISVVLAFAMEPGRTLAIDELPAYAVRVEDLGMPAAPTEEDEAYNQFRRNIGLTVRSVIKSRERLHLTGEQMEGVAFSIEQVIYEFPGAGAAKFAIGKLVSDERGKRNGRGYESVTQNEEINFSGFDELFGNGSQYQYCARQGRFVIQFGFYVLHDPEHSAPPDPEKVSATQRIFLQKVYERLEEGNAA